LTAKQSFTSESEKGDSVGVPPRQKKSKPKAEKRKVSEDSTLSKQEKISKNKRKKERCRGEDEMANKDAKQNEKKKRKKEITASYYHLVVPTGTNVINDNGNVNDNGDTHEEVVFSGSPLFGSADLLAVASRNITIVKWRSLNIQSRNMCLHNKRQLIKYSCPYSQYNIIQYNIITQFNESLEFQLHLCHNKQQQWQ
jgi:hypothetical protein